MKPSLSELIGNTPLVELELPFTGDRFRIFAKLEMFNPGGSIKDRPALYMIEEAVRTGRVTRNTHLIESSSGNLAIAMAMIAQQMKLEFTAVIDPNITTTNRALIEAYGSNIELVEERDEEGGYLQTRIRKVRELLLTTPNSLWLNQYANPDNPEAHYHGAGAEITRDMPVVPTHAFVCVSTCGTIMGLSRRLKEKWPDIRIVAVDIAGSVIFTRTTDRRRIPGIGASRIPEQLNKDGIDEVILVNDFESVEGCRLLTQQEGLLAGGSSGSAIAAIRKFAPKLPDNSVVVTILPDRGERYLDTVYNPEWLPDAERIHRPLASSLVELEPTYLRNAS
jgi:cysteine synthase A